MLFFLILPISFGGGGNALFCENAAVVGVVEAAAGPP
jgi:hypothetical protein